MLPWNGLLRCYTTRTQPAMLDPGKHSSPRCSDYMTDTTTSDAGVPTLYAECSRVEGFLWELTQEAWAAPAPQARQQPPRLT
jgi:hypothetical protein